ncbi:hypothetical protein AAC03nite_20070 [Alicyclobacillus acidoterrestris]|nr:hypothetical protein AAC03nite_20070 [Alicyclobacillus acidoterrestris]
MSGSYGKRGINELARALDSRTQDHVSNPAIIAELGTIQADMSLKCDHFGPVIAKGDYWVARSLTLEDPMVTTSSVTYGDWTHSHTVPVPDQLAPLKPGDRVLVNWVNNETVPVVIDVVVTT